MIFGQDTIKNQSKYKKKHRLIFSALSLWHSLFNNLLQTMLRLKSYFIILK